MLADLPFEVLSLKDALREIKAEDFPVSETGRSFAENARLKAAGYARRLREWTLADDSGLEIAALGGRPGVNSARYGGEASSYPEKIELLLKEIAASQSPDRSARFVCSIAIADDRGAIIFEAEADCRGSIATKPVGSKGFGYDPIFIPEGERRTFGEMDEAEKRQFSHRARAFSQIIPFLRGISAV
jgi:XTP/dITP diphosphohydrolase